MAEPQTFSDVLNNMRANLEAKKAAITPAPTEVSAGPVESAAKAPRAPAPEAKQPRIRMTSTQRGELKEFTKNYPEFAKYMSEFQPVNQTADAARQPALIDYLSRNPIPEVRQAAQNTFRPTLQLESPYRFGQQANLANLRNFPSPDPLEFASADRYPLAGTFERNAPQIEPPGVASQRSAGVTSRAYLRNLPSPDPLELASADRLPPVRGAATAGPRAASAGPSMGEQMGKGYVPKGFWEGATVGGAPASEEASNLRKAAGAAGLAGAALTGGLGTWLRRTPAAIPVIEAGGIAEGVMDPESRFNQAARRTRENVREAYRTEGLPAAIARQIGSIAPMTYETLGAAGAPFESMAGSAGRMAGSVLRNLAVGAGISESPTQAMARAREIYERDIAPTRPRQLPQISVPGAPSPAQNAPSPATAAAGAPSVAGRVTPGTGRPGATPGQQRGELDLTGMSFKDAFAFARNQAEAEGVDATGRFMWRGNAYQTNVGPARGRERYVPESQQTRLGNLPQLADAIAPTPQPAPAGERVTEVLPRSAPVTPAAPAPAGMPPAQTERIIIPLERGGEDQTSAGMPPAQERGRIVAGGETLAQPNSVPEGLVRIIRGGRVTTTNVPSETDDRRPQYTLPPDEQIEFDRTGKYARSISESGRGAWTEVAKLDDWRNLPREPVSTDESLTSDAKVLSTAPWRYQISTYPVVQDLWSRAMRQFGDLGMSSETLTDMKNRSRTKTTTTDLDVSTTTRGSSVASSQGLTQGPKGDKATSGIKVTRGGKTVDKDVDGEVTVNDVDEAIRNVNKSSNREAAKYDVIEKILQLDRQMAESELARKKTTLEVQGKERSEKNASRLQEITTDLRGLEADPRAKTEFAPLIRQLRREQQDLMDLLGKD